MGGRWEVERRSRWRSGVVMVMRDGIKGKGAYKMGGFIPLDSLACDGGRLFGRERTLFNTF